MHALSNKHLAELLRKANISCSVDEDGDLYTLMEADDDFPFDVVVWFTLSPSGEVFTGVAHCEDFIVDDVLRVANDYNASHNFLTALADEDAKTIAFYASYRIEGLTEEYFMENCICNFGAYVWKGCCDLYNRKR